MAVATCWLLGSAADPQVREKQGLLFSDRATAVGTSVPGGVLGSWGELKAIFLQDFCHSIFVPQQLWADDGELCS